MTRREFNKLFAVIFAWLAGMKLEAEETDNTGFRLDRTRINDRTGVLEKALSDAWVEENSAHFSGLGILQTLMLQAAQKEPKGFDPWVSDRERKIVAMVIQWLGTNCGRSFLYEASKRAGEEFRSYPFYNYGYSSSRVRWPKLEQPSA